MFEFFFGCLLDEELADACPVDVDPVDGLERPLQQFHMPYDDPIFGSQFEPFQMDERDDGAVFPDYRDGGVVDFLAEIGPDEERSHVPRFVAWDRAQLDATPIRSLSSQNSSCGSTHFSISA